MVTDSDQQLVVIDSGLQAHHRVRVVGRVGVFHCVGKDRVLTLRGVTGDDYLVSIGSGYSGAEGDDAALALPRLPSPPVRHRRST